MIDPHDILADLHQVEALLRQHLSLSTNNDFERQVLEDALKAIMNCSNHFVLKQIYEGNPECQAI